MAWLIVNTISLAWMIGIVFACVVIMKGIRLILRNQVAIAKMVESHEVHVDLHLNGECMEPMRDVEGN